MKKRNIMCLIALIVLGSDIISIGNNGYHSYLSLITAYILFIPFVFLFDYLSRKSQVIENGVVGRIFGILTIVFLLYMASIIIFSFNSFISITGLYVGNKFIFLFVFYLLVNFIVRKGITYIGRLSHVSFFIVAFSLVVTLLLSLNNISFDYLLPIVPVHFNDYLQSVILYLGLYLETFVVVFFLPNNSKKDLSLGYLLGTCLGVIVLCTSIGLLGDEVILKTEFPFYSALSLINFMNFLSRIEALGLFTYFFFSLNKLMIYTYVVNDLFHKIFKVKINLTIIPFLISVFYVQQYRLNYYSIYFILILLGFLLIKKTMNKKCL